MPSGSPLRPFRPLPWFGLAVLLIGLGLSLARANAQAAGEPPANPPADAPDVAAAEEAAAEPDQPKPDATQPDPSLTQPDPARTQPELDPVAALPSPEQLQLRIGELQAQRDEAQPPRKTELEQAVSHLQAAREALLATEAARQQRDQFEQLTRSAPEQLEALRERLGTLPPPPQIDVPADADLNVLQQRLAQAEAELAAAVKRQEDLKLEFQQRGVRRAELPARIADWRSRVAQLQQALTAPRDPNASEVASDAKRLRTRAELAEMQARIAAGNAELASYDARSELIIARQEAAARDIRQARDRVELWQQAVSRRREAEAQALEAQARESRRHAQRLSPAVAQIAERSEQLAAMLTGEDGLNRKLERATNSLRQTQDEVQRIREDREQLEARYEVLQANDALALYMRRQLRSLPQPDVIQRRQDLRSAVMSETQLQRFELEDQLAAQADLAAAVQRVMAQVPEGQVSGEDRQALEDYAATLLQDQRQFLRRLLNAYDSYFAVLSELQVAEEQLQQLVQEYRGYIAERILWVRSDPPLGPGIIAPVARAGQKLFGPQPLLDIGTALWADVRQQPAVIIFVLAVIGGLVMWNRRAARTLPKLAQNVRRPKTDSYWQSLHALVLTVSLALPIPLLLYALAWRLGASPAGPEAARLLAQALVPTATTLLVLLGLREVAREDGLAEIHLRWSGKGAARLRHTLTWLAPVMAVVVLLFRLTLAEGSEDANQLARLLLIAAMIVVGLGAFRILHPEGPLVGGWIKAEPQSVVTRTRRLWFPLLMAQPALIAIATAIGYFYTATVWAGWVVQTLRFLVLLILIYAFILRWLFVLRRDWLRKAHQREQEGEAAAEEGIETLDLPAISEQTRGLVRAVVGFALVVGLWWIWSSALPALGVLDTITLWNAQSLGAEGQTILQPTTLADLLLAVLVGVIAVVAARNGPAMLELTLFSRLPMDAAARYAATTITGYILAIAGLIAATQVLGFSWSNVQWLAAALTVGIGFGLQEIVANFVSGLIILFEQPVRVGDTVTIGDTSGTVTRIKIRATTVRGWDMKELVVPNKEFVTGRLVNWTLENSTLRVVLPVGVAYGSDIEITKRVLSGLAREHPRVLADPGPIVVFLGFGDSTLNFELRVFIPSPDYFLSTMTDLNTGINRAFKENGIEIAFPQRDLHIRSFHPELPIRHQEPPAASPATPPTSLDKA